MSIKASVIGCGSIARFHFAALEKIGVNICWVCDLDERVARPYAEKFNAIFTNDYTKAVRDDSVDAVFVLTNSTSHKNICLSAIQAGKAVVCEKTLSENPDDSYAIINAAQDQGTVFYTSYMKRFIPAVQKAKTILPQLGQIFSSYFRSYQPWGDLWTGNPQEGFFHNPGEDSSMVVKFYGGGILVCGGSHILDLIGYLLGRPTRLSASMIKPSYLDYDLLASAIMETPNGVAHFEAAAHPLTHIGFQRDGWDERIEINGTQGRLEIFSAMWDAPDTKDSILVHYDNRTGEVTEHRFGTVSPFLGADNYFCTNIERGTQGSQRITTGYDVDELIAHIQRSAETKQAVDVNYRL